MHHGPSRTKFPVGATQASLVASDRLYGAKKQVLDSMGMGNPEEFPITTNGMPLQMLSYLRLARLQDPAEFAKARLVPTLAVLRLAAGRRTVPALVTCHAS